MSKRTEPTTVDTGKPKITITPMPAVTSLNAKATMKAAEVENPSFFKSCCSALKPITTVFAEIALQNIQSELGTALAKTGLPKEAQDALTNATVAASKTAIHTTIKVGEDLVAKSYNQVYKKASAQAHDSLQVVLDKGHEGGGQVTLGGETVDVPDLSTH